MWYSMIKRYYENKNWTIEQVQAAVVMNKITVDEYKVITGEDYAG